MDSIHRGLTDIIDRQLYRINELEEENNILQSKIDKLKQLLLLTDKSVSNVQVNDTAIIQWMEFIKTYPDEE